MGNIHTVGPDEALIVSGGCFRSTSKKMVVGGWAWAWCAVTDVQRLKLEVMTLSPKCENVETSEGVPLTVTAIAQCKIATERDLLTIAAEQFLGKDSAHIRSVILQTLEGHLRAVLGTLTVEDVYKERDQFASLVREVATPDVSRMGIEVLSFTIKDVHDEVDYLASLGKARTAAVKRDASVGVAQAERDASIREAECEKAAMDIKYSAETKIEEARKTLNIDKAQFDFEVNAKKEEAKLAYELQAAKMQQMIKSEEMEISVVERKKLIAIESKEVERKEKELLATIKYPAEAEAYKLECLASGYKAQTIASAEAEAAKIRQIGHAEADALKDIGVAEAERMRLRAAAYQQYSDSAILSMTLEALPRIAAELAAPLAKTDEIVVVAGNSSQLTELLSIVPKMNEALSASSGGGGGSTDGSEATTTSKVS